MSRPADALEVERVRGPGRVTRLVVPVVALGALLAGTLVDRDDWFPFGPLAQYATATKLDGQVRSTYVLADTTDGTRVRVPLDPTGTGIGRAEVEGQLGRITEDPALLQSLSDAWSQLHPDRPQYVRLLLMRDDYQLRDGRRVGAPTTRTLAVWTVRR